MPRISYTKEEKGGGKFLLPPGEYHVFLTDFQHGVSQGKKTSGAETLNLKFETQDGQWIFDTLIFHESTAWRASAFLRCFGFAFDEGAEVDVSDEMLNGIIGRVPGMIEVGNKPYSGNNPKYQGQMQNVLKAYVSPKGASGSAATPAEDLSIPDENIPF